VLVTETAGYRYVGYGWDTYESALWYLYPLPPLEAAVKATAVVVIVVSCRFKQVVPLQNSTVLWEHFNMAVMNQAIKIHHATIRSLLPVHRGYESATEGDSFILAFHSPRDALAFCIQAQTSLMDAVWPRDLLLGHEECQPVMLIPL
jgi:hypothetical protein